MRPIRPERGVTLIELVIAMVLVGIIVAAIAFFLSPIRQSTDLALRAELTDIADNTLQRIGREVKLALPNSVRLTSDSGLAPFHILEFLALREAGRYRAEGGSVAGGTACDADDPSLGVADNDQLSFDLVPGERCFKTIGLLANAGSVTTTDYLVLNNFGPGFPGQDAYEAGAANRAKIDTAVGVEANRNRMRFEQTPFARALHDSPAKRFHIISGPVSFRCDTAASTITRYWNYGPIVPTEPVAAQPKTFTTPNAALIAEHVVGCEFEYANVGPQLGLLTMRITLRRALFGGASETVSLFHAVHVSNTP